MKTTSLLQLNGCTFRALEIKAAKAGKTAVGCPPSISIDMLPKRHVERPSFLFDFALRIQSPSEALEEIYLELQATLSLPADTPEEQVSKYFPVTCVANLLGVCRGALAQWTALFEGGPYMLPLLNVLSLVQDWEQRGMPAPGQRVKKKPGKKSAVSPKSHTSGS